jgi:Mitochondrial import 2
MSSDDILDTDSLASLPSDSSDSSSSVTVSGDVDVDADDAEQEWKESLQQLELLLTMVIVPYLGRYVGRKCAYWGELAPIFYFISVLSLRERESKDREWTFE